MKFKISLKGKVPPALFVCVHCKNEYRDFNRGILQPSRSRKSKKNTQLIYAKFAKVLGKIKKNCIQDLIEHANLHLKRHFRKTAYENFDRTFSYCHLYEVLCTTFPLLAVFKDEISKRLTPQNWWAKNVLEKKFQKTGHNRTNFCQNEKNI